MHNTHPVGTARRVQRARAARATEVRVVRQAGTEDQARGGGEAEAGGEGQAVYKINKRAKKIIKERRENL